MRQNNAWLRAQALESNTTKWESEPCHSLHLGQITCTHYICFFICKMEMIIISTLLVMVKITWGKKCMSSTEQTTWHTVPCNKCHYSFCCCGSYDSQVAQPPPGFQEACKGQLEMGSQFSFTFDRVAALFSWTCSLTKSLG